MDPTSVLTTVHSVQNILQAMTSALTMTAYLFPLPASINDGNTFDYIVVGGGTSGCVVANRLTEDSCVRVLLIEAGDDPPLEAVLPSYVSYLKNSKMDWNYTSMRDGMQEFHKNGVAGMLQARMLGGTSSANFMGYVRGSPVDFDTWAAIVKDESWNYNNVLPYFKKSENCTDETILNSPYGIYHGTKGNMAVSKPSLNITYKYLESFKELGHNNIFDINGRDTLGYLEPMRNIYHGIRQSTAFSFLGPAKDRENLYVAKNTLATRVIFDENNNAIGVEATTEDGRKITFNARREVIVTAGAINSPKLLMLSGIGPKQHLKELGIRVIANLPVGENLQDHSPVMLVYPTGKEQPEKPKDPHNMPAPKIFGFVAMNKRQTFPDYHSLIIITDAKALLRICTFTLTFKDKICQKLYEESEGKEVFISLVTPVHPKSRGCLRLRSTEPTDKPLISLGIYSDTQDLVDTISYIKDFNRIKKTNYFRGVNSKLIAPPNCEGLRKGSHEYFQCHAMTMVSTIFHYVGTCAMGSVVDSRLRVYGVNRLRVVDGSIMPIITSGNPNIPIMMIGEKAADMIKEDNNIYC